MTTICGGPFDQHCFRETITPISKPGTPWRTAYNLRMLLFMLIWIPLLFVSLLVFDTVKDPWIVGCNSGPLLLGTESSFSNDDVIRSHDVRILCWINTWQNNLNTKAKAIKETWGRRCDKLLFFSDQTNTSFPTIGFNTTVGRMRMVSRIFKAFDYIYENHYDDADWFMRSDDDTYVIMENLRYMLTSYNASERWYLGRAYNFGTKQGFNSGGAALVLSKAALKTLYERPANLCKYKQRAYDDLELGICLYQLGVQIGDTRDSLNRSRFHPYRPIEHLHGHLCNISGRSNLRFNCTKGMEMISKYTISFHHLKPDEMYLFEMLLYHIHPFAVRDTLDNLNKHEHVSDDKTVRKEEFKVYFRK